MKKNTIKKRGSKLVRQVLAAVCVAALVLGLIPGGMTAQAADGKTYKFSELKKGDILTLEDFIEKDVDNPSFDSCTLAYAKSIGIDITDSDSYGKGSAGQPVLEGTQSVEHWTFIDAYNSYVVFDVGTPTVIPKEEVECFYVYPYEGTVYFILNYNPHTHSYGEASYEWSADYSECTASVSCTDGDDTQTEDGTVTSKVTQEASCEETELTTYMATFENDAFVAQTKEVQTGAALGHTLEHHDAVAATTTETGTKEYWQCSVCGKYFSDAEGENEINEPETIPVIKPDTPAQHTHTLVYHAEVAATTIKAGTKAYWQCSDCGKYFSDAEGKTEIEKPEIIPIIAAKDDGSDKGSDNGSDGKDATTTTATETTTTETAAADTTGTTANANAAANTAAASDSPKTGDGTPIAWLLALMLVCGCGAYMMIEYRKSGRND